jgi:hypothetical protein
MLKHPRLMTSNILVFGIGTMFVLMTTIFLDVTSKAAIAQQQEEETSMIPVDNTTTTT